VYVAEKVKEEDVGTLCELHVYSVREDDKGVCHRLRVGSQNEDDFLSEQEESKEAALVLSRYYLDDDDKSKVTSHTLEINSPHIKKALLKVVEQYPGASLCVTDETMLFGEPRCLFHYRKELTEYALACDNETASQHIRFVMQYMERVLATEIIVFDRLMHNPDQPPGIDFEHLWMAFRPDDLYYCCIDEQDVVGKFQAMHISRPAYARNYWTIQIANLIFDGKSLGYKMMDVKVFQFEGYKPLQELQAFPITYHPDHEELCTSLLTRGKKYLTLIDAQYLGYSGPIRYYDGFKFSTWEDVSVSSFEGGVTILNLINYRMQVELWSIHWKSVST
jgi:hypothetical protein